MPRKRAFPGGAAGLYTKRSGQQVPIFERSTGQATTNTRGKIDRRAPEFGVKVGGYDGFFFHKNQLGLGFRLSANRRLVAANSERTGVNAKPVITAVYDTLGARGRHQVKMVQKTGKYEREHKRVVQQLPLEWQKDLGKVYFVPNNRKQERRQKE